MDDFAQQARGTTGPFSEPGIAAAERKTTGALFFRWPPLRNGRRPVGLESTHKHTDDTGSDLKT